MKKFSIFMIILGLISISVLVCTSNENNKKQINISVAASLKEAILELKKEYELKNNNVELVINYGSSGTLKQQIEQGAPCDLFISAGKKQVDELNKKCILNKASVRNLVKNKLVLISSNDSKGYSIDDLTSEKIKHIGIGHPESVPAGEYAYETLKNLNLEEKVKDKLVYAKDVKEVLAWAQVENVDVGFVYSTDAVNNNKINIIKEIDDKYHSPIIYPMAIIKDSKNIEEAKNFQEFLFSKEGQDVLKKYGYKEI